MQCLELGRLITYPVEARRAVGMAMMGGMCAGDSKFRAALGKGSARGDGGDGGDGGHAVAVEVRGAGCPEAQQNGNGLHLAFVWQLFCESGPKNSADSPNCPHPRAEVELRLNMLSNTGGNSRQRTAGRCQQPRDVRSENRSLQEGDLGI